MTTLPRSQHTLPDGGICRDTVTGIAYRVPGPQDLDPTSEEAANVAASMTRTSTFTVRLVIGCARSPKEHGPGPMYPPPPTADRGQLSRSIVAVPWALPRPSRDRRPGPVGPSRGRRSLQFDRL
jgi:hypothetical protein